MTNASTLFGTDTGLTVNLDHTLDNPDPDGSLDTDRFGESAAISGNYAIVGAPFEDESGLANSGKAYIYNVTTGALVHTLTNPNDYGTVQNDYFGDAVAISGDYAIVGAYQEDSDLLSPSTIFGAGAAYIFNVTTGALIHTLKNPNPDDTTSSNDYFGRDVGISGNYAIVGAGNENEATGTAAQSGKAYIFDVLTGALVHTLANPNPVGSPDNDIFGFGTAISGNYAIVSARQEDDSFTLSGKVYIFNVSTGNLLYTLDNPNPQATALFGWAVSASGNYAIVGVKSEDVNSNTNAGRAYIYNLSTGNLVHTLENPNEYGSPDNDNFGESVSISGNYAMVGTGVETASGGDTSSGIFYIFNVLTGALVATVDNENASGSPVGDNFGGAVGISGDYVIASARNEDNGGKAYIYNLEDVPGYDASVDSAGQPEFIIDPTVYTAAFVASKNRLHKLDVSGGAFTVDMPLSPIEGDRVEFRFVNGSSPATNNLTFSKGATSAEIENDTNSFVWDVDSPRTVAWIYTAEDGWIIR